MTPSFENVAKSNYDHARSQGASHAEAMKRVLDALRILSPGTSREDEKAVSSFLQTLAHTTPAPTILNGEQPFQPWFTPELKEKWIRWSRYRRYLLELKSWAFDSVAALDASSDAIISHLGDPRSKTPFDRRGLVAGSVQSGKTASYMALMAKAADAGYKVVIVLAGIHNSLRHQTQYRIDEEIVGVGSRLDGTSEQRERVGVGLLEKQSDHPPMNYLTSRGESGDFSAEIASKVGIHVDQVPLLLVVKKNVTVLQNLVSYLRGLNQATAGANGVKQLHQVPLLLIDDEADQASVNFRSQKNDDGEFDPSLDPSRVNEQIRKLLMTFSQRTYVGYTATPFANVLIPHEAVHPSLGPDLFPRDFIVALHPPDDYVGPKQVFGGGILPDGTEDRGLPVVRVVDDSEGFLPGRHRQDHVPGDMPASLRRALLTYFLSGAVRLCRGQDRKHHTMLVHVTRFMSVQHRVAGIMGQAVQRLRAIMEYGSGAPGTAESRESLLQEFRAIWDADIVPSSAQLDAPLPSWEEASAQILPGLRRVTLRIINGDSSDVLDYENHAATGAWVLAVGGDKLSRGLTLEGLCVSYYLRASRTYDTLMQMGRWFGYRPGYRDLCRIYTTRELVAWFQHIVLATEELWAEFEAMQRMGNTPREFGLRVTAHPDMEVTSPGKMREAKEISLNYSGTVSETIMFDRSGGTPLANQAAVDSLVQQLGTPLPREGDRGPCLWKDVPAERVVSFLRTYRTHEDAISAIAPRLAGYIEKNVTAGLLTTWTIALMSAKSPGKNVGTGTAGTITVNRLQRSLTEAATTDTARIRRMLSPSDEMIDLDENEMLRLARFRPRKSLLDPVTAQDARGYDTTDPPGRVGRPATRGLLILYPLALGGRDEDLSQAPTTWGMAASFPRSSLLKDGQFVANTVWAEQMAEM